MIIQTSILSKNLPSLAQVKAFIDPENKEDFFPVFYDIETTGLSRASSFVYLIGAAIPKDHGWSLTQWMAEGPEEEKDLLLHFFQFLKKGAFAIQYNGASFDQPFLQARASLYAMDFPLSQIPSLDLYRTLKPLKGLLGLPDMKQPTLESFLKEPPRLYADGNACIRQYQKYEKEKNPTDAAVLLGHNQEDLSGLVLVFSMTSYLQLLRGDFHIAKAGCQDETLSFTLLLPDPLPVSFASQSPLFFLSGENCSVHLRVPLVKGRLRQYYQNYRDYVYLPGEDMAIPKTLAAYMDKSLFCPALPDTCFTWFAPSDDFLGDAQKQETYLKAALPVFLSHLK